MATVERGSPHGTDSRRAALERRWERLRPGFRGGFPYAVAAGVVGVSFGAVAEPLMGPVAPIVMSVVVFAGSAQFAATAVLLAGGGALLAVTAGILLNARFIPMGIATAPSLTGGRLWRAVQGQALVDASWALANRGEGRFDRDFLIGSTLAHYPLWVAGTAIGVLGGGLIGDPETFGLDAMFPAFFLALLVVELRNRAALPAAALGALLALALVPFAPAGVPVIAAALAALIALRDR
jgi:4-azaleucine resistance transporter AzlC